MGDANNLTLNYLGLYITLAPEFTPFSNYRNLSPLIS